MAEPNAQEAQKDASDRRTTPMVGRSATARKGYRPWRDPWVLASATLIGLVAAVVGIGLLISLLFDGGNSSDIASSADVRILSPSDGETIKGPVLLTVESPTRLIADPAEGIDGAAHFHAFVDIHPFTPSGEVIPEQEGIYHFYSSSLTLDLPPGSHRIILVLGDNEDVRIPGATVTAVSVTVE